MDLFYFISLVIVSALICVLPAPPGRGVYFHTSCRGPLHTSHYLNCALYSNPSLLPIRWLAAVWECIIFSAGRNDSADSYSFHPKSACFLDITRRFTYRACLWFSFQDRSFPLFSTQYSFTIVWALESYSEVRKLYAMLAWMYLEPQFKRKQAKLMIYSTLKPLFW